MLLALWHMHDDKGNLFFIGCGPHLVTVTSSYLLVSHSRTLQENKYHVTFKELFIYLLNIYFISVIKQI